MKSLVKELQFEALDSTCSITVLLRKAKVVATKLDLPEFLLWIKSELDGYRDKEVPHYRTVIGRVKAHNPYHGWQLVNFGSAEIDRMCSTGRVIDKVAELEELAKKNADELQIPYTPEKARLLKSWMNPPFEPTLAIPGNAINGILDSIRNIILDWSLELERQGIIGDGMSFSDEDKHKAHQSSATYQIGNIETFTGNIGSVSDHSVVNASSSVGVDTPGLINLIEQIRKHQIQFELSDDNQAKLEEKLAAIEAEIMKKKPESSRIGILLGSVKAIIQSAVTNLVVHGALFEIDKYKYLIPS